MNEHLRENPFLTREPITPLPLRPDNKASSFDIGYNHLPPDLSSAPQSQFHEALGLGAGEVERRGQLQPLVLSDAIHENRAWDGR